MVEAVGRPIRLAREHSNRPTPAEIALHHALEARARAEGLSNSAFAEHIGFSQSNMSRALRGETRLRADTLARIVSHYPEIRPFAARYLAEQFPPAALALLQEAGRLVRLDPRPEIAAASGE